MSFQVEELVVRGDWVACPGADVRRDGKHLIPGSVCQELSAETKAAVCRATRVMALLAVARLASSGHRHQDIILGYHRCTILQLNEWNDRSIQSDHIRESVVK